MSYRLTYPARKQGEFHTQIEKLIPGSIFGSFFDRELMRVYYKKIPGHWLFPIILGALVTATGHFSMFWRSIALVFCALFLSLDAGLWISERPSWSAGRKSILFSVTTCFLFCLVMYFMGQFLNSTLEEQRKEVLHDLTANHYLRRGAEDDPMSTMFSVTNNSQFALSRQHQIACFTNLAIGNGGTVKLQRLRSSIVNGQLMVGDIPHVLSDTGLRPGGDAQTDPCLAYLEFGNTDCVDVELEFWYSLDTQPDLPQEKKFRFVAIKSKTGGFDWYTQPIDYPSNYYCSYYDKTMTEKR
jgi:hypothetical protein